MTEGFAPDAPSAAGTYARSCHVCDAGFNNVVSFHRHLMSHPGRSDEEHVEAIEVLGYEAVKAIVTHPDSAPVGPATILFEPEPVPEAEYVVHPVPQSELPSGAAEAPEADGDGAQADPIPEGAGAPDGGG